MYGTTTTIADTATAARPPKPFPSKKAAIRSAGHTPIPDALVKVEHTAKKMESAKYRVLDLRVNASIDAKEKSNTA
jgi:hypothetical protein